MYYTLQPLSLRAKSDLQQLPASDSVLSRVPRVFPCKAVSFPLNVFVVQCFLRSTSDTSFSPVRSFCLPDIRSVSFWIRQSAGFIFCLFLFFFSHEGRCGHQKGKEWISVFPKKSILECFWDRGGLQHSWRSRGPFLVSYRLFVLVLSLKPVRMSLNFTRNLQSWLLWFLFCKRPSFSGSEYLLISNL